MEQKKILIPGGKLSDLALVHAAHRLGLYVITSGTHKDAPAHKFSDEYVYADYSDKEAMLQLAIDKKIDYMCSCANDFGMISTAYVCEKLGLPGHDSYETCLDLHHKDRLKPIAKKLGLHSPVSEMFTDREEAIKFALAQGKKVMVKPTDNVASIGVSAPETPEEIVEAIDLAFSKSKIKTILVEPFVEGFYVTCTSMIINQEVVAFFAHSGTEHPQGVRSYNKFPAYDRNNGWNRPACYINEWAPEIIEDFNKLAKELKLADGKFHAELMVNPATHKAQIFDLHRRMSGFLEPVPEWNYTTPLKWEDWIVRAECGMDLSDFPKGVKQNKFYHARHVYAPRNGLLKRVVFDEYLSALIEPRIVYHDDIPSHIDPVVRGKNFVMENIEVTDYYHKPIIDELWLRLSCQEEVEMMAQVENDQFYKHITFEYAD